jgi:hypothetical protein
MSDSLATLYAIQEKYWVSIPNLIWKQLYKCWKDMMDKRLSSALLRLLPFPYLITKFVMTSGIPFPKGAVLDGNIPVFGLAQWNQSIATDG